MINNPIVRRSLAIIVLLFLISSIANSQLLRPHFEDCCIELAPVRMNVTFSHEIDTDAPLPQSMMIANDKAYRLFLGDSTDYPEWIKSASLEGEELTIELNAVYDEEDLRYELPVLADICYNCFDTIAIITIEYEVQDFKSVDFARRIEFGYINSNISSSVGSIFGNEEYDAKSQSGFLIGLDLVSVKSPKYLSDFNIALGVVYRNVGLTGTKDGEVSNVKGTSDFSLRFIGDLPMTFVAEGMKDFSFKTYLTLPAMSLSTLSFDGSADGLNDEIKLNIAYGFGFKYQISESISIEARMIMNEFETTKNQQFTSNKITYDDIRNEVTISVNNLYEKIHDIFSL
jgi:hypothetical protein